MNKILFYIIIFFSPLSAIAQWATDPAHTLAYPPNCSDCTARINAFSSPPNTYLTQMTLWGLTTSAIDPEGYLTWSSEYHTPPDSLDRWDWLEEDNSAVNSSGEVFVSYCYTERTPDFWKFRKLFVQKYNTDGNPQWGATGVSLFDAPTDTTTQIGYNLIPDTLGGVYVIWGATGILSAREQPKRMLSNSPAWPESLRAWIQYLHPNGTKQWDGRGLPARRWDDQNQVLEGPNFATSTSTGGIEVWDNHNVPPDSSIWEITEIHYAEGIISRRTLPVPDRGYTLYRSFHFNSGIFEILRDPETFEYYGDLLTFSGETPWDEPVPLGGGQPGSYYFNAGPVFGPDQSIIVTMRTDSGTSRMIRLTSAGAVAWEREVAQYRQIVGDGAGGAIFTPVDSERMYKFDAAGQSVWDDGVVYSTTPATEVGGAYNRLFPDNNGGCIYYWLRGGKVYGQLVNRNGDLGIPTAIHTPHSSPSKAFQLHALFPNPANAVVHIPFTLPYTAEVSLIVYNLAGQQVATITHGQYPAGRYLLQWSPSDATPGISSGVYFLRLRSNTYTSTQKWIYLK